MNLENEIQQFNFRNENQKLAINLIFTANWLQSRHRELLKPYDLSPPQYNILRILRGQSPNTISLLNIKARMLDKMSDVSRLVEKLRSRNFVSRVDCPKDRRLVDVCITEEGLTLLKELDILEQKFDVPFSHFSTDEIQHINTFLDTLRNQIEKTD